MQGQGFNPWSGSKDPPVLSGTAKSYKEEEEFHFGDVKFKRSITLYGSQMYTQGSSGQEIQSWKIKFANIQFPSQVLG